MLTGDPPTVHNRKILNSLLQFMDNRLRQSQATFRQVGRKVAEERNYNGMSLIQLGPAIWKSQTTILQRRSDQCPKTILQRRSGQQNADILTVSFSSEVPSDQCKTELSSILY